MQIYDLLNNFNKLGSKVENLDLQNNFYWIQCYVDELESIKLKLGIKQYHIKDCEDFNKSSRIEFLSDYLFIVCNILDYYNKAVHSREMYIFLGENYIVTAFKEKLDLLEGVCSEIIKDKSFFMFKQKPYSSLMLYYILDRIIIKNYSVLWRVEDEIDKTEISILKNTKHEQLDELINLRRQVYRIRKYLNPLSYIGDSLVSNDNLIIEKDYMQYFLNLNHKINRLLSSLENLVQDIALAREAFESEMANKNNDLMKIFTLIATIFLPLNLLTSMHGMNVKYMPFMDCDYAYFYIIVIMIIISLMLIGLFKKKKWL